jgi:hypothetical protein
MVGCPLYLYYQMRLLSRLLEGSIISNRWLFPANTLPCLHYEINDLNLQHLQVSLSPPVSKLRIVSSSPGIIALWTCVISLLSSAVSPLNCPQSSRRISVKDQPLYILLP